MKQELQDLHLKAMFFDLTNEPKPKAIGMDRFFLIEIKRPYFAENGCSYKASATFGTCGYTNDLTPSNVDRVMEYLKQGEDAVDALNAKYADILALSMEDVKRLRGGEKS